MLGKKIILLTILAGSLILTQSSQAYAFWGWFGHGRHQGIGHDQGGHRYHHSHYARPHWGTHVRMLPTGFVTVWGGHGDRYYYNDGVFYNQAGADYAVVAPPAGVVVNALPAGYQAQAINGITYYVSDGTYYTRAPNGFEVVPAPGVLQNQTAVVAPTATDENAFIINVPNSNGGYTPVAIKRSGKGYVGPQGEFYATFPKVSQLKVMYGK